jgi:DNA-binding NarL/FixJ family response regulator
VNAQNSPSGGINILLLQDSAPLRALLAELLGDLSFVERIEEADDVPSALAALERVPFNFAVLDLNIPGVEGIRNGIDLTRAIKSRYPHTKVALLTALGSNVDRDACMKAGADRFYDKGEFEDLLDWITETVERKP